MLIDELRDLRYFVEVARCRSFTSAAIRLSVSSGAVSKAVSRLEDHMHKALFVRSNRTLRLTTDGEKLFARVDDAYLALDAAWTRRDGGNISGTVHLSTFSIYGRVHLARYLPMFLEAHPQVEVIVSVHDNWRSTGRDRSDIRITWNEPLDEDKVAQNLAPQRLIMVGGPGYLARRGTPGSVAALNDHDCIGGIGPNGSRIHWHFVACEGGDHAELIPKGQVGLMDEMSMAIHFARHNAGLTLVAPEDVEEELRSGTLVRVMTDHVITTRGKSASDVVLQYRPRHRLSRAEIELIDCILHHHRIEKRP